MMNHNMNNSSILSLNAPVSLSTPIDAVTQKPLVFPTPYSIITPNYPDYIQGQRFNTNHYGTQDITEFKGGPDNLISAIGADFKAIPTSHYYMTASGDLVEASDKILVNDKTGKQIGKNLISDRYEVFDFDEGIYYFWALLEEIKSHGYQAEPAVAKIYGAGGAKMFLQYRVFGADIMGEPVDTFLTLLTSHDKSMGFTIALSMVRLFCQNQIHRMLKEATNRVTIRHMKAGKEKIQLEAQRIMRLNEQNQIAMQKYLGGLADIKVDNNMIFEAMSRMYDLYNLDTQVKINKFTNRMEQLMACYNMPDVENWKGTALGAYYAYSDMQDHVVPLRKIRDEAYLERSADGNIGLGEFADILVEVAK